jgi:uncharacterized membrane protein
METAALAVYYHAAQMIKAGKSREEIITDLIEKGISRETANNMLDKLDESRANVARNRGYRNLFLGVVLIVLMILPIFGLIVPQVTGTALGVAVLILGCGFFAAVRGIMQIIGL